MKKIWAIITVLLLTCVIFAGEPAFRGFAWGESLGNVKAGEQAEFIAEDQQQLTYAGEVEGYKCQVVYSFMNDKLVSGSYVFDEEKAFEQSKILRKLKQVLYERYGRPDNINSSQVYKNKASITWKTANATIILSYPTIKKGVIMIEYKNFSSL